jgi:hypothetical protein
MSQSLNGSGECTHFFPGKTGPTIRILLYTDDPINVTDDVVQDFSLGVMLQHLAAHAPTFASLCVKLVSRNSNFNSHADRRLDDLIKNGNFDQVWFFGTHQGNRTNFTMEVLRGGPHSELDDSEVEVLENWMRVGHQEGQLGGGVLMTGDHAEPRPADALPPATGTGVGEFWSLGRALGIHVPRAGKLRSWEGPPSRNVQDSQNTQVLSRGLSFEDVLLQFDPVPQRLILETFDANGKPAKDGLPHPLFIYKAGTFIEVYPDHVHEGTVVIPSDEDLAADASIWPNSLAVKPQIVARGTDTSKRAVVDLIAAYNGDRVDRGRIVADSTWHHYFNVNLNRFIPPGEPNSSTDQIGQYYANLAIWLTPLAKRREMAQAMISWLASHPALLEERFLEDLSDGETSRMLMHVGERAHNLLAQVATQCEIHELLAAIVPAENRENVETLYFPEKGFTMTSFGSEDVLLPSKQLLLGSYVNQYHRDVAHAESSTGTLTLPAARDPGETGFKRALNVQSTYVKRLAAASNKWFTS